MDDLHMDRKTALDRVGGDWQLLREVAQLFLDHCDEFLSDIRRAIDDRNAPGLERSAHNLKGSVSNFGATAAVAAALALEILGRQAEWDGVAPAYQRLSQCLADLRPEMEQLARNEQPS